MKGWHLVPNEANEIHWLLRFFSRSLPEQRERLPDEMAPVWLRLGEIDCEVDEPARLLSLVLAGLLDGCGRYFGLDASAEEALDILDELRVLLFWFMLESFRDAVFAKPKDLNEPDEIYGIWKTVARICRDALDQPAIRRWEAEDLSFEHFVEKYSVPIS